MSTPVIAAATVAAVTDVAVDRCGDRAVGRARQVLRRRRARSCRGRGSRRRPRASAGRRCASRSGRRRRSPGRAWVDSGPMSPYAHARRSLLNAMGSPRWAMRLEAASRMRTPEAGLAVGDEVASAAPLHEVPGLDLQRLHVGAGAGRTCRRTGSRPAAGRGSPGCCPRDALVVDRPSRSAPGRRRRSSGGRRRSGSRTLTGASQLTWKWAIRLSSKKQVR